MGAPVLIGPFTMPMFRSFVPEKIRPWLYVLMAFTFQFSGGVYLGTMGQMMGETAFMREDIMMCLYANLAGMAIWFPMLFRMKFRFTNKTLLTASAAGALVCNVLAPQVTFLPLLWALCFIEGICKIEGTFECMSTIQLWMTPKRDFTIFFPFLHIVILGSMQLSSIISVALAYWWQWTYMNYFIAWLMMLDLILLLGCIVHTRVAPKFPLFGIDWLGGIMWAAFLLQVAYFFCYGQFHDWFNSPVMRTLAVTIPVNLVLCIGRMLSIRHPYYEPKMWTYRHLFPILALIAAVEAILATEHVLEETFRSEVMHYTALTSTQLTWFVLAGAVAGCLFAWWWMNRRRWSYIRLITFAIAMLAVHMVLYYFTISTQIHISSLYLPSFLRGFSYAILSATFMVCLEEIMTFQHFFQSLSVFNMLHMVIGGVVGAAFYSRGLSYLISDNITRYGAAVDDVAISRDPAQMGGFIESFMTGIMEVSVKQLYGVAAYACILLLLLFLLYDAPVRRRLKLMPAWRTVRDEIAASFRRETQKKQM